MARGPFRAFEYSRIKEKSAARSSAASIKINVNSELKKVAETVRDKLTHLIVASINS
jgi:hypothetical protein